MTSEYRPIPFRWILPVGQLLLCIAILWPLRSMLLWEIRSSIGYYTTRGASARDGSLPAEPGEFQSRVSVRVLDPNLLPPTMRRGDLEPSSMTVRLWVPALMNFPASLAELPISLRDPNGRYWAPVGIGLHAWRAISWPVIGVVLWWIAGRGFEAIIASRRGILRPRITWADVVIAVLLVLMGAFALLAPIEADVRNDPQLPWRFLSLAGMMWLAIGVAIIASRFAQRRIRHGIASQNDAAPALS
jgi:hypothetical protein